MTKKQTKTMKAEKAALIAALCLVVFWGCGKKQPAVPVETPLASAETPAAAFTLNVNLSAVTALAFSEDGAYLAGGFADGSFALWRLADGERIVFLPEAEDIYAAAVAEGVTLWNGATEPEEGATVSTLNREKSRRASGYGDGGVILKDAATGTELARFISGEGGEWISITPKGYFNASARGGDILTLEAGEETYTMSRLSETFRRPDLYEAAAGGKETAGPSAAEVAGSVEYQPPAVEILGPGALSVTTDTAELSLRIRERGGGTGRLVLYHNGTPVGTPELGDYHPRKRMSGGRAVYELTVEAALEPGMNVIGVSAFDRQQVIESEVRRVEVRAEYAAARSGKPVLYVLAAAITGYEENPVYGDLSYPEMDAEAVGALFAGQKAGTLYADVVVKRLSGKEVTRAGFRGAFNELRKRVTPEDTFVFFYAGHGDVDEGKDFFLVPWDAASGEPIVKEDLIDSIAKIRAKNALVLLDTCRSGALIDMKTAFGRLLEKMGQKAILVAASGEQGAVESGGIGHGVFTKTLLETAGAAPPSPGPGEGRYRPVGGVIASVREAVPREVRRMQEGGLLEGAGTRGSSRRDLILQEPLAKLPEEDFPLLDRWLDPGEVAISAASEGSLVIEGAAGGRERLSAGARVKKRLPEKAYTLAMLYADGKREAYPLEVQNNGTYEVAFTYRAPPPVIPAPVAVIPAAPPPERPVRPEDFEIEGTVLKKYTGNEENVVIPGYLGITEIGERAFRETKVKSVIIPPGVTSIGDSAFYYCFSLASISIPGSVTSIGNNAFHGARLSSVDIPAGVISIGDYAFFNCDSLASINIPASVTGIGVNAFYSCDSLASVSIQGGVTSIGAGAFASCPSLGSIRVEDGNTAYASREGVLYNKNFTVLVQYPAGKRDAHYNIPAGVTRIGDSAFLGSPSLSSVSIPPGVTSIGVGAFYSCTGLSSVDIPAGVTTISSQAFSNCTGLSSIRVEGGNTAYASRDGILYNKNFTVLIQYPAGKRDVHYSIPAGVTSIGDSAFANCTGLSSVSLPSGVTFIAVQAFLDCYNLTSISIPDSVTSIGRNAFSGCRGLASISIPDSVSSIGVYVFTGCTSLKTATLSRNTKFEENSFPKDTELVYRD